MPKAADGRVDAQLTNISLAYTNEEYIADKILPAVPNLSEYTGVIGEFTNDHLRIYETAKRATWDEGQHRVDYNISNDKSYRIDDYDLTQYVPDKLIRQLQKPFDAKKDALNHLEILRLQLIEDALSTALADATVLTNTATPTNLWSDYVNSDPLADIETWAEAQRVLTGRRPNHAWTNSAVISKLTNHPSLIARVAGLKKSLTRKDVIEIIKDTIGLKDVFVGSAIKVNSKEGQTQTKTDIWQDDFGLFFKPNGPSLMTPSFGYRFEISGKNKKVTTRRELTADKGDLVTIDWARQDKILDINSAYLGDQVIT